MTLFTIGVSPHRPALAVEHSIRGASKTGAGQRGGSNPAFRFIPCFYPQVGHPSTQITPLSVDPHRGTHAHVGDSHSRAGQWTGPRSNTSVSLGGGATCLNLRRGVWTIRALRPYGVTR